MFKNRIVAFNDKGLRTAPTPQNTHAVYQRQTANNGSMGSVPNMSGTAGRNVSVNTMWSTEYQYYFTGLLPAALPYYGNSDMQLGYMYRDIYLYDSVGGAAVDIQSTFPFSDFSIRGLEENELKHYRDAVDALSMRRMMPQISKSYLTDGFHCSSMIFDERLNQFRDQMVHDALNCTVRHVPFYNLDADIRVRVPSEIQGLLGGDSPYVNRYLSTLPPQFLDLLRQGSFRLDPVGTLFIPRETLSDRAYTSYLQRLLPMYLIEKAMFRGTLTEAHKRQRALSHITAGNDMWVPTDAELTNMVQQMQMAEFDPLGGWIATRDSVQVTDLRPGGDFWKWTDMVDIMVAYKLRALGISEAFLSGDASYASAESAYSTFLESQDSYRYTLTELTFYNKIFPLVAATNGLFKDGSDKRLRNIDVSTFLFDPNARASLKIPEIVWHKELQGDSEDSIMEGLELLDSKGFPIPLKMWITAAGVDPDTLLQELEEDTQLREKLGMLTGKDTSHDSDEDYGDEDQHPWSIPEPQMAARHRMRSAPYTASSGYPNRVPLLKREFDPEIVGRTRTGKRKVIHNQKAARQQNNENILKAAVNARDPNYREFIRRKNIKRFGTDKLGGHD